MWLNPPTPSHPIPSLCYNWNFTVYQDGVLPKDLDLAGVPHHTGLIPVGQRGQREQIPPRLPQPNLRDLEHEQDCRA